MNWISQSWPWYVAGPLIGLTVPVLLIIGNKTFGISSSLRHLCAACLPGKIEFFNYNWKKEIWNLVFVLGILVGGLLTSFFLGDSTINVSPKLMSELNAYAVNDYRGLVPVQLFNWEQLITLKGASIMIGGGFLVGFGSRYAGGCTSGHAISGLSNLQWPSLIATICFMVGGFIMANIILPFILSI
jgi:uncharacterized membrane protein YedE/YeeE